MTLCNELPSIARQSKVSLAPLRFWMPFILLTISVLAAVLFPEAFFAWVDVGKSFFLNNFSWLIVLLGVLCLLLLVAAYVSPFGRIIIGGRTAEPMLSRWQWFSITLCTTIAINILFWPVVEPLHDLLQPPAALGIAPNSEAAARFAVSAMFMNWGLIPYAINALPALVFALCFYNLKLPFSLGSIFHPLFGEKANRVLGNAVDIVSLYALALGMGTSLGTCSMVLGRGLGRLLPNAVSPPLLWALIICVVIVISVLTSVSGVTRGIRAISELNTKLFFGLLAFVFLTGPTVFILDLGTESLGLFMDNFFSRAMTTDAFRTDSWPQHWTVFSFANYMIWAPISALFLGRIARGYTVRQFLTTNVILPVSFILFYITVFSSTAIWQQIHGVADLQATIITGIDEAIYILFEQLPFSGIVIPIFLFITLISFITATNSTTNAMAALTTKNLTEAHQEAPAHLKAAWGIIIGGLAFIMLLSSGIDGMKTLTYLGGTPITLVILGAACSLVRMMQTQERLFGA